MRALSFFAALCAAFSAAATPFSVDVTDLWWNPDESGWGVNFVQQGNTLFATIFVYGADGRPRWFVASEMTSPGAPSDMPYLFTGALYESSGPVFSGAFNPNAVTRRSVGNITFEYRPPNSGILTYTVDGAPRSSFVQRQTWRVQSLAGEYRGHRMLRPFVGGGSCPGQADVTQSVPMNLVVTHSGDAVTLRQVDSTLACVYSGTYTQQGRLGAISGSYSCADGSGGAFSMGAIEISRYAFNGTLNQRVGTCNQYGHIGGLRTETPRAAD